MSARVAAEARRPASRPDRRNPVGGTQALGPVALTGSAHAVQLQRLIGNRAVSRLVAVQRHSDAALAKQIEAAEEEEAAQRSVQRHPIAAPLEMGRAAPFGARDVGQMKTIVEDAAFRAKIRTGLKALVDRELPAAEAADKRAMIDAKLDWKLDAGNSVGAPATAGTDGIKVYYLNAMWYLPDGRPRTAYIRSVMLHEALHFVSANHRGFQTLNLENLNTHAKGGTAVAHSLDEAVTERVSREIAGEVLGSGEAYTTNYWNVEARRGLDFHLTDKGLSLLASGQAKLWLGDMVEVVSSKTGLSWERLRAAYLSDAPADGPEKSAIKAAVERHKAQIGAEWKARSEGALKRQLGQEAMLAADWKARLELRAEIVNLDVRRRARREPAFSYQPREQVEAAVNAELAGSGHVVVAKHDARSCESVDDWEVVRSKTKDIKPPLGSTKADAWAVPLSEARWGPLGGGQEPQVTDSRKNEDPNAQERLSTIRGTRGRRALPPIAGAPAQAAVLAIPGDTSIPIGLLKQYIAEATHLLNMEQTLKVHPMGWVIVPWEASPEQGEWRLSAKQPFREYGPEACELALDKDRSLSDVSGAPPGAKARAFVHKMGGGGYEANGCLGILNIEHVNLATVVHEMGHHKQNVEQGYNEKTIGQVPNLGILLDFHNILVNENQLAKQALGTDPFIRLRYTEEPVRRRISEWKALAAGQQAESVNYKRFKARLATLQVQGGKYVEIVRDIEGALADSALYPDKVPILFKNMMVDEVIAKDRDKGGDPVLRLEPEAERAQPRIT